MKKLFLTFQILLLSFFCFSQTKPYTKEQKDSITFVKKYMKESEDFDKRKKQDMDKIYVEFGDNQNSISTSATKETHTSLNGYKNPILSVPLKKQKKIRSSVRSNLYHFILPSRGVRSRLYLS